MFHSSLIRSDIFSAQDIMVMSPQLTFLELTNSMKQSLS